MVPKVILRWMINPIGTLIVSIINPIGHPFPSPNGHSQMVIPPIPYY